jgi:DNA-binding transcriptional MocR family regulator
MSKPEYLKLADTIGAEIADGTFRPGDRLPPQRNFAYERKIAVSTASRVYAELLRRGLVVGEVGRGHLHFGRCQRQRQVNRAASGSTNSLPDTSRSDRAYRKSLDGRRNLRRSMPH